MNNRWFEYDGAAFCLPPKNGGTSLYRKLFAIPEGTEDRDVFYHATQIARFMPSFEVNRYRTAVLGMRDPVDRFASLWRDKCRNGDANFPQLSGMTPYDLLNFVRGQMYANAHWAPQSGYWSPAVVVVPNTLLLSWFGVDTKVNYTTRNPEDPPMPVGAITSLYADDMRLLYGRR